MTTAAAALLVVPLAACQTSGPGQTFGTVGGAAVGGLIGSQFGAGTGQVVATGAGTALGALAGAMIGSSFDQPPQTMTMGSPNQPAIGYDQVPPPGSYGPTPGQSYPPPGQAHPAPTYQGPSYAGQAYPTQTYPTQTYPTQTYPTQVPQETYY